MVVKIPVAILGATGSVGQRFITLLHNHPWFTIVALAASKQSAGKSYKEAANWLMPTPMPEKIGSIIVQEAEPNFPCKLVFSALDSSVAGDVEMAFKKAGFIVVSNASYYRMSKNVPLLVPEINSDHLKLLEQESRQTGKIVTNPNCSTIGLTLCLSPLHRLFGVEKAHVVTLQALSGAGYPGVASMDIVDNVIPYIQSEEEKIESEPLKILGSFCDERKALIPADIAISAQCNRVAVSDGHMACISVKLKVKPSKKDMIAAWTSFSAEPQRLELPSAPSQVVYYFDELNFPQPRLHRNIDKGMAVSVGRLRDCPLLDYKFSLLSHNTIRGAAGGAILCAEMMVKKGFF